MKFRTNELSISANVGKNTTDSNTEAIRQKFYKCTDVRTCIFV